MSLLKCATSFVFLTVSGSVPLESLSLSDSILVIKIVCSNYVLLFVTLRYVSVWLSCLDLVVDTIACPLVYLLTGKFAPVVITWYISPCTLGTRYQACTRV